MRTTIVAFALLCITTAPCFGQNNVGMATGNYAGIGGAWFNPASIVDSRYKFDMVVFDYASYFSNNFMEVKDATLVRRLLHKDPYNSSFDAVKQDLLFPIAEVDGPVHASALERIELPLSFMATTGRKSAIGLNLRNRTGMTLDNMDPNTARMLFAQLGDSELFGRPQNNNGISYQFMNWMDVGLTYGRVLVDGQHHFLKAAGTAKLLGCNSAGYVQADELSVSFRDPQHVSMSSPLIHYARTQNADFGSFSRRDIFNNVEDYAFGWDLGFVYELRGKVSKRTFTDFDAVEKERRDLNKHILRVGVALLDMGKFKLDRRPLTQDHSVNVTDWDISGIKASGFNDFDQAYSQVVNYVPNGPSTFTMGLPTAVSVNVDLHVFGGFYLGAATNRPANQLAGDVDGKLRTQQWSAITPRFESRFMGFYVPVSWTGRGAQLGATVRMGPFYAGSTNLAQLLANETNTSADFHFGMRFSIGYGKPSALKKKYEAYRKVQEGISSNKMRLDSLEREVYALKMVTADPLRGTTIVNNYYGADSTMMGRDTVTYRIETPATDQEAARLKRENEYLMNELARTSIAQQKDSAYIADLEQTDGKSKDRLKADRAASKAAEKQADAVADMAKEVEQISKRMKRQNRILAAGAATGVVAVATSGDKEKPAVPVESVLAINDSTVVIGTDTVRLVAAPGAAVRVGPAVRMSTTGDTAIVTVYDTVRVTVRDTIRVEQKQPVVATAPVNTDDEKELQRLAEPVYFATGSTTLGPQGKVKVEEIAAWLQKHPEMRVRVTGFADASGSVTANEAVADKRATSVRNELVKKGIDAARISTSRQLAEVGAAPSAKDRRAEVKFVK